MRTLAIHTGAIGDFLLACPALSADSADGSLELAGYPERLELAVAGGIARAGHDLDRIEFHTIFDRPSERLRTFLARFDRVIVWMRDPDGAIARGLVDCGVTAADVFPGLPDTHWTRHASEYYAHCLGLRDLPPLRLAIAPAGPPLDVVIHPGSGSLAKNWPIERFVDLAGMLCERGRRVTWCAGPAEIERGAVGHLSGEVLRCASLVELAGRIAAARLYIGNDSGITHLAAALGAPTVAIFGPTDPRVWAPRGENVRVLRGSPWPSVGEVISLTP